MALQLLPPGEHVLTQLAHQLLPGGGQSQLVLLPLVLPQLGHCPELRLAAVSRAAVLAVLVDAANVGGQRGLSESFLPTLVQLLAQRAGQLAHGVEEQVVLEGILAVSDHLPTGLALVEKEFTQVKSKHVLLHRLMPAAVLAQLALVRSLLLLVEEILARNLEPVLLANEDVLLKEMVLRLLPQGGATGAEGLPLGSQDGLVFRLVAMGEAVGGESTPVAEQLGAVGHRTAIQEHVVMARHDVVRQLCLVLLLELT